MRRTQDGILSGLGRLEGGETRVDHEYTSQPHLARNRIEDRATQNPVQGCGERVQAAAMPTLPRRRNRHAPSLWRWTVRRSLTFRPHGSRIPLTNGHNPFAPLPVLEVQPEKRPVGYTSAPCFHLSSFHTTTKALLRLVHHREVRLWLVVAHRWTNLTSAVQAVQWEGIATEFLPTAV